LIRSVAEPTDTERPITIRGLLAAFSSLATVPPSAMPRETLIVFFAGLAATETSVWCALSVQASRSSRGVASGLLICCCATVMTDGSRAAVTANEFSCPTIPGASLDGLHAITMAIADLLPVALVALSMIAIAAFVYRVVVDALVVARTIVAGARATAAVIGPAATLSRVATETV